MGLEFTLRAWASLLSAACVPAVCFALNHTSPEGVIYTLDTSSHTAEVIGLVRDFNAVSLDIPNVVTVSGADYKVTSIGPSSCYAKQTLKQVTFGNNVAEIKSQAFMYSQSIETVSFPSSLRRIEGAAFRNCDKLASVTLNEGLQSIADFAFYLTGITSANIPASVTSIGNNPFGNCTKLTEITVAEGNSAFTAIDGVLFDKDITRLISYPVGNSRASYTVPSTVKELGNNSMRNNAFMSAITFPDGLEIIGGGALNVCRLGTVNIPASVIEIGDQAFASNPLLQSFVVAPDNQKYKSDSNGFLYTKDGKVMMYGVSGVSDVEIPAEVETIDDYAFYRNTSLRTLKLGNSLTSIGKAAFYQNTGLASVDFGASIEYIGQSSFMGCAALKEVVLPPSVRTIDMQAFGQNGQLSKLTLSEGIDSIGVNAFIQCFALTEVTVPSTVRRMGTFTFGFCTSLKKITFKDGLEEIPLGCCDYCSQLTDVTLPATLIKIGDSAFDQTKFTSINWPATLRHIGSAAFQYVPLTEVTLPDAVETINQNAFAWNDELLSFTAGSGLRSLGDYALACCGNLTQVKLNEGLESIGTKAIGNNSRLTTITIPSTVTAIGGMPFDQNPAMVEIINLAETPQIIQEEMFLATENGYQKVTLKVPEESVEKYKQANIWSKFTNIIGIPTAGIDDVVTEEVPTITEIYNLQGVRLESPMPGVNIVRMSDGSTRKVVF